MELVKVETVTVPEVKDKDGKVIREALTNKILHLRETLEPKFRDSMITEDDLKKKKARLQEEIEEIDVFLNDERLN